MTDITKSIVVRKFGGYDSLQVKDFDLPPLEGNIEVKVEYGGLNFADLYTRQGLMMDKKLPFVLGMECSGTITAIGVDNTDLKIGQRVVCYDFQGGLYRHKVRVHPKNCFLLPDDIDFDIAASLFVNYLTAYFAVHEIGNLKENEKILIMSCAGGVGCAATQLARTIKNVEVYGTGSDFKEKEAKENGVDVFLSNESFLSDVNNYKFDIILCTDSGPILECLQSLLKPLGRLVILGANNIIKNDSKLSKFTLLKLWWNTKNFTPESLIVCNRVVGGLHLGMLLENDPEKVNLALNVVFNLLKEGKIKPRIHSVWSWDEIVEATKILAERKNVGKVLLKFNE